MDELCTLRTIRSYMELPSVFVNIETTATMHFRRLLIFEAVTETLLNLPLMLFMLCLSTSLCNSKMNIVSLKTFINVLKDDNSQKKVAKKLAR